MPDLGRTIQVATSAQLTLALKTARTGDTILLTTGNYGDVTINRVNTGGEVTIRSADVDHPATFNTVKVLNSSNLTIDQIKVAFTPTATTVIFNDAVLISGSSHVALTNSVIKGGPAVNGVPVTATVLDATHNVIGLPTGRGINMVNSTGVTIAGNDVSSFAKGIVLSSVDGVTIAGNQVHDMRTSLIAGGDVSNAFVDANHLYNSSPWSYGGAGDHGDFIIFWTTPTQDGPSDRITITNNFIDQAAKTALTGIYLDDNNNRIGYTNALISNNVISNDNAQAIRLENVQGVVSNNTAVQARNSDYHTLPGVVAMKGTNVELIDNVLGRISIYPDAVATQSGNLVLTRADYSTYFANALIDSPTLADLAYLSGTSLTTQHIGADLGVLIDAGLGTRASSSPDYDNGTAALNPPRPAAPVVTTLTGTTGTDSLSDEKGARLLDGGAGDDKYTISNGATQIVEHVGGGIDKVFASVDFTLGDNIENLTLSGLAKTGIGNALDNALKATDLGSTLYGLGGKDSLVGGAGSDTLLGGADDDRLSGEGGDDFLWGDTGNDTLLGGAGNDILNGGDGDDSLTGGAGIDAFTGGRGADKFIFGAGDLGSRDQVEWIMDFSTLEKDKIALNGIDANIHTAIDDKFAFIGTSEFSHVAGQLRYSVSGGTSYVMGDIDGDGIADFTLALANVSRLASADFIL